MVESIPELMPILIEFLQDSSLAKRETALWVLGQLIQNTGYVIEPYRKHPELLDTLLGFLKNEKTPRTRREVRVIREEDCCLQSLFLCRLFECWV